MCILLLIGSLSTGSPAAYRQVAEGLAETCAAPVLVGLLDGEPSLNDVIWEALEERKARALVVVAPLLEPMEQRPRLTATLSRARARWPAVQFHEVELEAPLLNHMVQLAQAAAEPESVTALLLVGKGGDNPHANANLARLALLLEAQTSYGWVGVAFQHVRPGLATSLERCQRLGAQQVLLLPCGLFTADELAELAQQAQHAELDVRLTGPLFKPGPWQQPIVEACWAARESLAANPTPARRAHGHDHSHGYADMGGLLPPRYQSNASVSAAPMAAADLVYDDEGQVAWDRIWTSFCDLALAGGPPHRGDLLEPVSPQAIAADRDGYEWVLSELERGVQLVSGLVPVRAKAPGWLGLRCESEDMALWLLRAIVVENISVRREGRLLFVPAGPNFRPEAEIKNIITVVAKTYHYWTEHVGEAGEW
ncbi:MAG: sirohydrochlorin chelatase [Chloroflexaceae bacterium]|nr:sirohydrochlorin chelatase [Chloroflexaceae bacterium]